MGRDTHAIDHLTPIFYIHGPVFIHSVSTPRYVVGLLSLYWVAVVIEMKHLTYTYFATRGSPLFSQYSAVALQEALGLDLPRLAVTSRLRRFSRYEEREKVVYDVSCGNACDVSVIVCRCNFDDVCATRGDRSKTLRESCGLLQ